MSKKSRKERMRERERVWIAANGAAWVVYKQVGPDPELVALAEIMGKPTRNARYFLTRASPGYTYDSGTTFEVRGQTCFWSSTQSHAWESPNEIDAMALLLCCPDDLASWESIHILRLR